ncbi:hypothetical protein B0H21DRAFT_798085 [Amylocystis lapponica]|nr:hypothetical protein B0H21DRAFT_798085 [Amylocystis lapponica]
MTGLPEDGEVFFDDEVQSDGEPHVHDFPYPTSTVGAAGDTFGTLYDCAFEWPGDAVESLTSCLPEDSLPEHHTPERAPSPFAHSAPSLRLLVQRSSVLPKKRTIAVVDGHAEVQFGRDVAPVGSDTPRIRLKDMAVSKLHATVYWDQERQQWAAVDMGSKHGTFLQSRHGPGPSGASAAAGSAASDVDAQEFGLRLSPSRTASIPRTLEHLDQLTMGSTAFVVHIHPEQIPCIACSPKGNDEIPLFDARPPVNQTKRKREPADALPTLERDPKKALTMLKHSLLSHRDGIPATPKSIQYVDRSARRRALHHDSPLDTPGTAHPRTYTSSPAPSHTPRSAMPAQSVSAPPRPLPNTNIGHRLLMKQGWQPGTSLGQPSSDIALVEPLELSGNVGRSGLGLSDVLVPAMGWREAAKSRRWAELKAPP